MITFYAIVHKDPDSAFGLAFPDLPGCFSASDTEADIYANAQEALALYLEDASEIPTPRSIEELRRDPELRAELAEGAFIIGVPLVFSARKERFNLMLDRAQVESVDVIARRVGVSRSEFVARAIEMRLTSEVGAAVLPRARAAAKSGAVLKDKRSAAKKK